MVVATDRPGADAEATVSAAPAQLGGSLRVDAVVLDQFWNLASLEPRKREAAATVLVERLQHFQVEFTQTLSEKHARGTSHGGKTKGARIPSPVVLIELEGNGLAHDVRYAAKRLVRGLGSAREGARQGFALALTALMATKTGDDGEAAFAFPGLSAEYILGLVNTELLVVGSMKGQEQRDFYIGQVFACGALVRSGRLTTHFCEKGLNDAMVASKKNAGFVPATELAGTRGEVVKLLLRITQKKTLLAQSCVEVLISLCTQLSSPELHELLLRRPDADTLEQHQTSSTRQERMNEMHPFGQWLCVNREKATAEHLQVALSLAPRLPAKLISECHVLPHSLVLQGGHVDMKQFMGSNESLVGPYLSNQYLRALAGILKVSTQSHPRLHAVWALLLRQQELQINEDGEATQGQAEQEGGTTAHVSLTERELHSFWKIVVEEVLLTSSLERKYCALQLCWRLIPLLPPPLLRPLLSRRFLRFLVQQHSSPNGKKKATPPGVTEDQTKLLFSAASRCVRALARSLASMDPEGQVAVLTSLQSYSGGALDSLLCKKQQGHPGEATRGSDTEDTGLLSALDEQAIEKYIGQLCKSFCGDGSRNQKVGNGDYQEMEQDEEDDNDDPTEEDPHSKRLSKTHRHRVWCVEQMCGALKLSQWTPARWRENHRRVLKFLALHAFFVSAGTPTRVSKKKTPKKSKTKSPASHLLADEELWFLEPLACELQQETRRYCGTKLLALIDDKRVVGSSNEETKDIFESSSALFCEQFVASLQEAPGLSPSWDLPEELKDALSQVHSLVSTLEAKGLELAKFGPTADEKKEIAELRRRVGSLLHLAIQVYLQLFSEPDNQVLMDSAIDLVACVPPLLDQRQAPVEKRTGSDEPNPPPMDVLVDLLLGLTALPSAPLRSAVETTFRAVCGSLTLTSLRDMLRIVRKVARKRRRQGGSANDDEDDNLFEEDEDEAGDESGDEDELDEEDEASDTGESEDGEEPSAHEVQRDRLESGKGDATAIDEVDDTADDEEMFRMDERLSAMFRSVKDKNERSKSKDEALAHFKFRVLALLETYVKRVPTSEHLPWLVIPLLKALSATLSEKNGSSPLSQRLAALLRKGVCKGRALAMESCDIGEGDTHAVGDEESIPLLVHRALGVAKQAQFPELAGCSVAAALFLTKIACQRNGGKLEDIQLQKALGESNMAHDVMQADAKARTESHEGDMIVSAWKAAFSAYLTKPGCRFPQSFLSDTIRSQPWLALALSEDLFRYCVKSRNAFLCGEAQQVLMQFMRSKAPLCTSLIDGDVSMKLDANTFRILLRPMGRTILALLSMKNEDFQKAKHRTNALQFCCACIEAVGQLYGKESLPGDLLDVSSLKAAVESLSVQTMSPKEGQMIQKLQSLVADWAVPSRPTPGAKRKNSTQTPTQKPHAKKTKTSRSTEGSSGDPSPTSQKAAVRKRKPSR